MFQLTPAHSQGEVVPPPRLGIPLEGETVFLPGLDSLGQPRTGGQMRLMNCPTCHAAAPEPPRDKVIALTIDDGPTAKTRALLTLLKVKDVPATFFDEGLRSFYYPSAIRQMVNEGHELANHSWAHPWMTWRDKETVRHEINSTELIFRGWEFLSAVGLGLPTVITISGYEPSAMDWDMRVFSGIWVHWTGSCKLKRKY